MRRYIRRDALIHAVEITAFAFLQDQLGKAIRERTFPPGNFDFDERTFTTGSGPETGEVGDYVVQYHDGSVEIWSAQHMREYTELDR